MLLSRPTASEDRFRSFRGLAQIFDTGPFSTAKNRNDVGAGCRPEIKTLSLPTTCAEKSTFSEQTYFEELEPTAQPTPMTVIPVFSRPMYPRQRTLP